MTVTFFLPVLALLTLLLVSLGALVSRQRTLQRKEDPSVPKSSLAVDAPSDRVAP